MHDPIYTEQAWWTVDEASRLLRVNRKTLYEACAAGEFPCLRFGGTDDGWFVRIPCEALRMRLHPSVKERTYNTGEDMLQMELPLDTACLIPVRRFRNTRELITAHHYERAMWRVV